MSGEEQKGQCGWSMAGEEQKVREEIKTINKRLILQCPEATAGSLNFSLRAKKGTDRLRVGKNHYLIQIRDMFLRKKFPGLVDELDMW